MSETHTPALQVERARELFFLEGQDPGDAHGLAAHISRSWRRCRAEGGVLQDAEPVVLQQLRDKRESAMQMLACAQPELDSLAEHAVGSGCVVILSDANGLILEEIGSAEFLPKAQRIALAPGVEWSEQNRGTNAIGTALAERSALMVLGGEHYLVQNATIGCAAAPVFDGRGQIAGVLDISGESARIGDHTLGLVRMAAQQVEHRLMLARATGHLLRFHAKPSLLGTGREGLLVLDDGHIVAANRVALNLLGKQWADLLDQDAEPWIGRRWADLQHHAGLLTLPNGRQLAATIERTPAALRAARPTIPVVQQLPAQAAPAKEVTEPLLQRARKVLDDGLPVLITGETGSGKEVFARRLHQASRRANGPFVAVNCAALPETLIEAELFGYEAGAFTGARRRGMPGRIREAAGGILFLDEIGDMPLALQARLLRVLEDRVVLPLGGGAPVKVDFDLVCATHRDLEASAAKGEFRTDLLYRVNGFGVHLPALRNRTDRRSLIAQLFSQAALAKHLSLDPAALDALDHHPWPGNFRELASVLRALVALADDHAHIGVEHLPHSVAMQSSPPEATRDLVKVVDQTISGVLSECQGNVAEAARRLGVHRSTVYRHLAQAKG